MKQVVDLTVNHRGPLPLRELYSTDETIDPGETLGNLEPVYDLFTFKSEFILPDAMTQTKGIFVKQVFFLTMNHPGLILRELHSTGETIVWRDPGGS